MTHLTSAQNTNTPPHSRGGVFVSRFTFHVSRFVLHTLLNRRVYKVAPFGPATVVVADLGVAKQVGEYEPGVGRALADAAIGNHVLVGGYALATIDFAQLVRALEGAVLAHSGCPGDVLRAGDVAAALRSLLWVVSHVDHLARVLGV